MRVAFGGLGLLGRPMAARLASAHQLTVWNRTGAVAEQFATAYPGVATAATPRELAVGADAVVLCLSTTAAVREILDGTEGLISGLKPGAIVIDCTSGDPAESRRIAELLASHGVRYADAPVSGGPPMAERGALTIMTGSSEADRSEIESVLAPVAGKFVHLGPVGVGHAMKSVNNAFLAVNLLLAREGLIALAKAGVAPRDAVDVIAASSGNSYAIETMVGERVLTRLWPKLFRLALLEKDIGIGLDFVENEGVDAPVLAAAREAYRELRTRLGEQADYLDPIRDAELTHGVELRG